jgi:hypothetical protein
MIPILIYVSDINNKGFIELKRSLDYFSYEYYILTGEWNGAFTRINAIYNWVKENKNKYEYFINIDAYDSFFVAPYSELERKIKNKIFKIFITSEKNCFPVYELAKYYPKTKHDWKYLNGGGYIANCEYYIKIMELHPFNEFHSLVFDSGIVQVLDQEYWTRLYLLQKNDILLDYNCEIFQTTYLLKANDYLIKNKRVVNIKTNSKPIVIHGNNKQDLTQFYKLL